MRLFEGTTADEVWQQMASAFRTDRSFREQPSRGGPTYEMLHVVSSIADPRQRWVYSRRAAINPAFALAEVVWILTGRQDIAFLEFWFSRIREFLGENPNAYGAYGHRLRSHHGIDQLERAFQVLSRNPETRQVVLQIWDAETDLPNSDGSPRSDDIPCNLTSVLKIREGRLEWLQLIRSNDLYLGVPYNYVQFTMLQEIIAGWLGVALGTYNHISDSLHVYKRDAKRVLNSVRQTTASNSDSIAVGKLESDQLFSDLGGKMDLMRQPGIDAGNILELVEWPSAPVSFKNILILIGAEAARRHGLDLVSESLMAKCTNPSFSALWRNWIASVNSTKVAKGSPVA